MTKKRKKIDGQYHNIYQKFWKIRKFPLFIK